MEQESDQEDTRSAPAEETTNMQDRDGTSHYREQQTYDERRERGTALARVAVLEPRDGYR